MHCTPNLFLIGAPRAGSTSLAQALASHPDVCFSMFKEPHYFMYDGAAPQLGGPGDDQFLRVIDRTWEDYCRNFSHFEGEAYVAEGSTNYLYHSASLVRIRERCPDAQFVVVLRNPVRRAYSAYLHMRKLGHESLLHFEAAMVEEESRISRGWGPMWHYRRQGLYGELLVRALEIVEPTRLHVVFYEDLFDGGVKTLQGLLRSIGLREATLEIPWRHQGGIRKENPIYKLLYPRPRMARSLGARAPRWVRRVVRNLRSHSLEGAPPLSAECVEGLYDQYFRSDGHLLKATLPAHSVPWLRTT